MASLNVNGIGIVRVLLINLGDTADAPPRPSGGVPVDRRRLLSLGHPWPADVPSQVRVDQTSHGRGGKRPRQVLDAHGSWSATGGLQRGRRPRRAAAGGSVSSQLSLPFHGRRISGTASGASAGRFVVQDTFNHACLFAAAGGAHDGYTVTLIAIAGQSPGNISLWKPRF